MSFKIRSIYRSAEALSSAEVERFIERSADRFHRVAVYWASEDGRSELRMVKGLEPLPPLTGVSLSGLFIYSRMPGKTTIDQAIANLGRGATLGVDANFMLSCDFEEKESSQKRSNADSVTVGSRQGQAVFMYAATGSRVAREEAYRAGFFRRLVSELELPMEVVAADRGFRLRHTAGGEVWTSMAGIDGMSPRTFRCPLAVGTDALGELLRKSLAGFGSGRVFGWTWTIGADPLGRRKKSPQSVGEVYAAVSRSGLETARSDVHFTYRLQDLAGLETLAILSASGSLTTPLLTGWLDERRQAQTSVVTAAGSHHLELTLFADDDLGEVEERTGLGFAFVKKKY